ncbi:MAG: DNA-directed RNA polymerase subunit alpha [Chloroflexi bacterium]|nr:DNA-directed RNA polymerase subunit alpha [Chloroflexota bacterium]
MVLPHKVESDTQTRTQRYGRFIISPLESGYGLTLGNALRRVLLSSLEGAAVTSLRLVGIEHEFAAIPHLREDMTQLMLNVKQLRLRLHDVSSSRLRLHHRGEGTITAADFEVPAEIEIINSELLLFTAVSEEANIELELAVQQGRGYSPSEERGRLPIGELPVDAIFSPVRRVTYDVQSARVGQHTNYDRLVIELWTDGTVLPEQALSDAAQILQRHLILISGVETDEDYLPQPIEEEISKRRHHLDEKPIEELDLSVRVFNALKRTGLTTIADVLERVETGDESMLAIRNFGDKSLTELVTRLYEKDYLSDEMILTFRARNILPPEEELEEATEEEAGASLANEKAKGIPPDPAGPAEKLKENAQERA